MQNQTQLVRGAINLFIVVAVSVALLQEIMNMNNQPTLPEQQQTVTTPEGETVPLQPTGPVIQGIKIQATDKYSQPVKQLLAKNKMNIELTSYTFEGNLYWMSLLFNWGHMILIYFLLNKYKTETDQPTKKKIMIGGALAVFAWFYLSAQLKPQAVAIEVNGSKVYDRDYFNEGQFNDALQEHEFLIDDLQEAEVKGTEKVDAWQQQQQQQQRAAPKQEQPTAETEEEIF